MAQQVKSLTSESLESAYRSLTPSQDGFTEDLMASNTIIPIIDLTESAEGSSVRVDLQTALAFGSVTAFDVSNTTTALANTAGFWRIFGVLHVNYASGGGNFAGFDMTDGSTTKRVWGSDYGNGFNDAATGLEFDFIVFLAVGESISAVSSDGNSHFYGNYRQIADVNGVLVNPSGFTPQ